MTAYPDNIIQRYQSYMLKRHGVFVSTAYAELQLENLISLFLLFSPGTKVEPALLDTAFPQGGVSITPDPGKWEI